MAAGDIGSVIDTFTFDASFGDTPEIIHVSGNVYAIVYTGPDSDGLIITVTIDTDGDIGAAVIDSYEFDVDQGLFPSIIHVSGDFFAIAFSGFGSVGKVRTVEIDSAGNITDPYVDSLAFDATLGLESIIKHVTGDIYAIAYRGASADGWICTLEIDSSGNIGAAIIDSLEYDAADGYEPKLIQVAGDIYAIAYRGTGADGFLVTLSIDNLGEIGAAVIDSWEFDTDSCYVPDFIKIAEGVFAIAYQGTDLDGFVITVAIDLLGNITAAAVDSLEFDTDKCNWPCIHHIGGNVYAIAYSGTDTDGFLVTLTIDPDGSISGAVLDSFEFDTVICHQPGMIRITANMFAVAYQGDSDIGVLKTISIEEPVSGISHELLMGIG